MAAGGADCAAAAGDWAGQCDRCRLAGPPARLSASQLWRSPRAPGDRDRPRTAAATPTILVRIPYSKQIKHILFARTIGHLWASHGYTTVIQGTRGRYESGGSYDPPFVNEAQDGQATLQWIAQQPWYDGHIGMWGGSYFGYTQWVLADQSDPGLSALIPQICSTDFYRMFYPGGAFSLESALYWATLSYGSRDVPLPPEQLQRGYEGWPLHS